MLWNLRCRCYTIIIWTWTIHYTFKSLILRRILTSWDCVTWPWFYIMIKTILFTSHLSSNVTHLSFSFFIINMICPIIISIKTYNKEISIFIISWSKYIFIHNINNTFYCTISSIWRIRLKFSSIHHDIANWLSILRRTKYLTVSRPFFTYILTIITC